MKFEYGSKEEESECVAYIDSDGGLCIKVDKTHNDAEMVCIDPDGYFHFNLCWNPSSLSATGKFYPGDKITITF